MINNKWEWPTLCGVVKKDLSLKGTFQGIPEVKNELGKQRAREKALQPEEPASRGKNLKMGSAAVSC